MKFIKFILIAIIVPAFASAALADVKVKSRQSVSGQTTESTTYIKGKRQRSEQSTGGIDTVTITQCDLRRGVQLNPRSQVYLINAFANSDEAVKTVRTNGNTTTETRRGGVVTTTVTVKDTGETKKMFGYVARHLIITMETESSADACAQMRSKMVTDGWYIDAEFALDCDESQMNRFVPESQRSGCIDRHEFKQIGAGKRGFPVIEKMTMFDASGKESFTMTNEVVELSKATLDQALFEIPAGYREVRDSASLYTSSQSSVQAYYDPKPASQTSVVRTVPGATDESSTNVAATVGDKKPGVIRIGLSGVKTGAVGEGMNAAELAGAIENALPQYLKGTKIELVRLEARIPTVIESEAAEKQCDYVLFVQVSHKKGGGGFGLFGKLAPALGNVIPMSGNTAGVVASKTVYTAANAAGSIKAKDELTLEVQLKKSGSSVFTKQFKTKAKSAGEDIISPLVEQAAIAIAENAR